MIILEKLSWCNGGCKVIDIYLSDDRTTVELVEACDMYYDCELDKSEFGQLIEELKAIHDQMVDEAGKVCKWVRLPGSQDLWISTCHGSGAWASKHGGANYCPSCGRRMVMEDDDTDEDAAG